MDADHVQAVKQVFTKLACLHQCFEILMRGRNDAHVDLDRNVPAHAIELAISQNPQQSGLCVGRHVADFIQKQGPAVSLLKAPAA